MHGIRCFKAPILRAGAGLALAAAVLTLSACASNTRDETAGWSPNKLYSEAQDEMHAGGYDKAITYFEKLEGRAAGTPLAQQAQLDAAYAMYKNDDKAHAIDTLNRFIELHPTSPACDYALYLKALVNFDDNLGFLGSISRQDLSERDQQAAKDSFQALDELVTRFPDSKYAPDARARMTYIVNSLALADVHVARYYYAHGAYVAAADRAQDAIRNYRRAPALEEALYILYLSYDRLGLTELRDDTRRVLTQNYPQSRYLKEGFTEVDKPWWKLW